MSRTRIIDARGRLLGRLNVLDAVVVTVVVLFCVPILAYAVRGLVALTTEVTVFHVEPMDVVAGRRQVLTMTGRNLQRVSRVSFGTDRASRILEQHKHLLRVKMPRRLPTGSYPIMLSNTWGKATVIPVSMGDAGHLQVISRPTVAQPVTVTPAEPVWIRPKPRIYDDVTVMVLCSGRALGDMQSSHVAPDEDWGYETEVIRLRRIARLPEEGLVLLSVFLRVQMRVHYDDQVEYFITGEPLQKGKHLYFKKNQIAAVALADPIPLSRLHPPEAHVRR